MTRKISLIKPFAKVFFLILILFSLEACQEEEIPVVEKIVEEPADVKRAKDWAKSVLDSLSLEQKIGQLLMLDAPKEMDTVSQSRFAEVVNEFAVGGMVLGAEGDREEQREFVSGLRDKSQMPIWVGMDVNEKWTDERGLPSLLTLGATGLDTLARDFGAALGAECHYLGGQMVFVSAGKTLPRGQDWTDGLASDPQTVKAMGASLLNGLLSTDVMAVARSLPHAGEMDGPGSNGFPGVEDFDAWKERELIPVQHFANENIGALQAGHFVFHSLDSLPLSLSHRVLHTLVKEQMAYDGFIFSPSFQDSLLDRAYKPGEAEAMALAAGTDVLVAPRNLVKTIEETVKLVSEGELSESDVNNRAYRVLFQKAMMGLDTLGLDSSQWSAPDPQIALRGLDRKITESSLTLLRDKPGRLPLKKVSDTKFATLSIGTGRKTAFQGALDPFANIDHFVLGANSKAEAYEKQLERLSKYNYVAISLHPKALPADSGGHLPGHAVRFLKDIQAESRTILVNFAAPSILADLDSIDVLLHAYDDRKTTELLAAQYIFGAATSNAVLPFEASKLFTEGSGLPRTKQIRLKNTIPEELGADPKALTKVDSIIRQAIYLGTFPGCQILAAKDGKVFYHQAFGHHDYERSRRVQLDDVYDIASVTKIAATTLMAMWSFDQDSLKLDSALKTYLPELDSSFITIKDITPRELLVHKAGLPSGLPVYKYYTYMDSVDSIKTVFYANYEDSVHTVPVADHLYFNSAYMDTIWDRARRVKLINYGRYKYSDMSMFLMKLLLERLHDTELDKFVKRKFYDPMGLKTITYHPLDRFKEERVAPTEKDLWWRKQQLKGHVHDPSTALFGGVGGQAGLFSNARDIATLMQMLLNGGSYGGKRYVSTSTVRKFTSRQANCHRGLGFDMQLSKPCDGKGMCCASASAATFGHTGFTGTCTWADPENNVVYVFLSNRVHPTSKNKKINIYRVRQAVQQAIYDALGLGLPPEEKVLLAEEPSPGQADSAVVAGPDSSDCADC